MVTMTKDELMKMLEAAYEEGSADGYHAGTSSLFVPLGNWSYSDSAKAAKDLPTHE